MEKINGMSFMAPGELNEVVKVRVSHDQKRLMGQHRKRRKLKNKASSKSRARNRR